MLSIAIPVADREECSIALDVAFKLGRQLDAVVVGYHMRPDNKGDKHSRQSASAMLRGAWPEQNEKVSAQAAKSAHKLFLQMAEQHDYEVARKRGRGNTLHAVWEERLGSPDKLMPLIGPVNDLLVVSRPRKGGGRKAWLVMMSALLDSGIPVLLLPQKTVHVPCRHVAVGWNRGAAEARAVHAMLPLLAQAEEVTFISVGKEYSHGPAAKAMINYLKIKGIKAVEHKVSSSGATGPALVQAAKASGADVLLTGAYTKGRIWEMLFGGVTEFLLSDTDFPVIMMNS